MLDGRVAIGRHHDLGNARAGLCGRLHRRLVLCQLGRAARSTQARRCGVAQRMGAERQPGGLSPRRPRAACGDCRLYRLFRHPGPALGSRRGYHHRKLALRLLRHVPARQPGALAAWRRRGGGAHPRSPVGHCRIRIDGDRRGGGPRVPVGRALSSAPRMGFARAGRDIAESLRFFTRLRVGKPSLSAPLDLDRIAWAAPVAGVAVGLIGALALALTTLLGLPMLLRAGLAIAALIVATGALHEDGLADVADGFGGGTTRARKLEIMRDSRVGAYGAIALALALTLRVGALTTALDGGFWRASLSLILVAALSRPSALTPLALLPPARADGAGAAAGRLDSNALAAAWGSALVIAVALGLVALGLAHALLAALLSGAGALLMVVLARRAIGGQTGDVAGAAQQCGEIAAWCGLLIGHSAT